MDDKKYGDDLIETIDFYDELEIMIKIVKPDLGPIFNDSEFVGGGYELNQSQIGYFEKKLGRKFDLKIVNLKTLVLMAQLSVFY
jgi:hypothetical protein